MIGLLVAFAVAVFVVLVAAGYLGNSPAQRRRLGRSDLDTLEGLFS